jgi:hypothetical protein
MGRMVAAVVAALALGACAEEPWHWHKPGASPQEFQQASYGCERDTRMAARSFGGGIVGQMEAAAFIERCMGAQGFYKQSVHARSAVAPANTGPGHPAEHPTNWVDVPLSDPNATVCGDQAIRVWRRGNAGIKATRALRVRSDLARDEAQRSARFIEASDARGAQTSYLCGSVDGTLAAIPVPTAADAASPARQEVWKVWAAKVQACDASSRTAAAMLACAGPPPS